MFGTAIVNIGGMKGNYPHDDYTWHLTTIGGTEFDHKGWLSLGYHPLILVGYE